MMSNQPPTASGNDQTLAPGASVALSTLFDWSDSDGTVTAFAVRDNTSGGGYLTRNGVRQTDLQLYDEVAISDIGNWRFVAGADGSVDEVRFNAIDNDGDFNASVSATVTSEAVTDDPDTEFDELRNGISTIVTTLRVRIHNQNKTTAAKAQAERKTFGHLS